MRSNSTESELQRHALNSRKSHQQAIQAASGQPKPTIAKDDAARPNLADRGLASDLTNSKTPQRKEPRQCEGRTARSPNSTKPEQHEARTARKTEQRRQKARLRPGPLGFGAFAVDIAQPHPRNTQKAKGERAAPDSGPNPSPATPHRRRQQQRPRLRHSNHDSHAAATPPTKTRENTRTIHVTPDSTTTHKSEPQNRAFRASETRNPEDPEQPETPGEWL
jgi:hypothetical protein